MRIDGPRLSNHLLGALLPSSFPEPLRIGERRRNQLRVVGPSLLRKPQSNRGLGLRVRGGGGKRGFGSVESARTSASDHAPVRIASWARSLRSQAAPGWAASA